MTVLIDRIIDGFRFHPSIKNIKRNYKITSKFSFKPVLEEFVKDIVINLSLNKAAGVEIPLKILEECDFSFHFLASCINEAIKNKKFPGSLKLCNIVPVHKEKDAIDETNYRPVSILPLLSKVFEKVMYIQLYEYMENFLSQLLCGFRKAHSTQHALLRLIQSWEKELDESAFVGTIPMNLSKAYDCLPHDLMVAKLEAYGITKESLQLISDYLSYCKKRKKLVLHIVVRPKSFAEFLKALYWVYYFLIFSLMTFCLSLKSQSFVTSQMITICIPMAAIFL